MAFEKPLKIAYKQANWIVKNTMLLETLAANDTLNIDIQQKSFSATTLVFHLSHL
jgi:hypothetical protein